MYCDVISRRSITMTIGYGHVMLTLALALGLATLSTAIDLTDFDEGELDAPVVPAIPPVTGPKCPCGINLAIMVNVREGLFKEHGNGEFLYGMIQEFIEELAKQLKIGMQPTHDLVGVVTYNKFFREQFGLKNYTNIDSLLTNGIDRIDYGFEPRSYPFKAMDHIHDSESFFSSGDRYYPRLHNRNAVIVFDDGLLVKSNAKRRKKLIDASDDLKDIATVFVIGLRNKTLDFKAYDDGSMDTKDRIRIDNWITMSAPKYVDYNYGRGNIITTSLWSDNLDWLVYRMMERIEAISTCDYLSGEDPRVCETWIVN